ncbi:MAG: T9SS type A sorting domain-containing protein [Flavobacteriales bacterium]|nr:T9SS type A sorting domain-containing protein [Flavobacteriales bacterium]
MEINKQISKQLLSYSAAAAAVMVSTSVNATIRVNQDGLMLPMEVTGGFDLDFNNDGIDDLNMQLNSSSNGSEFFLTNFSSPLFFGELRNGNSFYARVNGSSNSIMITSGNYASALASANPSSGSGSPRFISAGKSFKNGSNILNNGTFNETSRVVRIVSSYGPQTYSNLTTGFAGSKDKGNFTPGTESYLGMKFIDGDNNFYYGWAQFKVDHAAFPERPKLWLVNYAYEDAAGNGIGAGMTEATGVQVRKGSKANIYSFGRNIHINKTNKGSRIEVYNLAGKQVYNGSTNGSNHIIDMRGHNGMHIVKVGNSSKNVYVN